MNSVERREHRARIRRRKLNFILDDARKARAQKATHPRSTSCKACGLILIGIRGERCPCGAELAFQAEGRS